MTKISAPRFSIFGFLSIVITLAVLLAMIRNSHVRDIELATKLGPTSRICPLESSWIWRREHLVIETKWCGPGFSEAPMRRIGAPWFDRVVKITVFHDNHITSKAVNALRYIPFLTDLVVRNPTNDTELYNRLSTDTNGRVSVSIERNGS